MLRKYSILLGIIISLVLLLIATRYYPGGSQYDKNSIGYDWKNNYLSNLFAQKAVNGSDNASRLWAIPGMLFLSASIALFFIEFSKRISPKSAANVIRYFGAGAMLFAFLAVTPYHDTVVTIASTLALVSMFYITVFVFKSGLHLFKIFCVVCLLAFYGCMYIYYTGKYVEFLPVMQKISLAINVAWILSLQYFTTITDFQPGKSVAIKADDMSTNR
ncbi:MAG: hypothetical protein Q8941_20615 [Bacteroidota bacterium]|nr:hypothetical protein [Bacteroidota bacterium]